MAGALDDALDRLFSFPDTVMEMLETAVGKIVLVTVVAGLLGFAGLGTFLAERIAGGLERQVVVEALIIVAMLAMGLVAAIGSLFAGLKVLADRLP